VRHGAGRERSVKNTERQQVQQPEAENSDEPTCFPLIKDSTMMRRSCVSLARVDAKSSGGWQVTRSLMLRKGLRRGELHGECGADREQTRAVRDALPGHLITVVAPSSLAAFRIFVQACSQPSERGALRDGSQSSEQGVLRVRRNG
jgi:hypothetical protein